MDILSNFSRRLSEDLQELTLRYDQKIKENNELRKKLEDALSEQTRMQRKIESLEKHVSDTEEALISEAHSSASKVSESLLKRFEVVQREGRTNQFIIQLQMKLLAAHEENETLRQQVEDVKASNNELVKQLSKINVDYAVKKKETTKLSQQLKSQSAEMKSCESTKQKLREVQFQNAKLRCELQEKENEVLELIEVKRWTEALKVRFDLIVAEKKQVLENQAIVDSKCASQRDEIAELKMKLNHKERDFEELSRSLKEVEDNSRIYREERDFYCKSMKDTTLELEQARKEREETDQRHKKVLESKELNIRQQAEYGQQFETKYEEAKKVLANVKLTLKQEREENEELRKKLSSVEVELQQKVIDQSGQHFPWVVGSIYITQTSLFILLKDRSLIIGGGWWVINNQNTDPPPSPPSLHTSGFQDYSCIFTHLASFCFVKFFSCFPLEFCYRHD